MYLSGVLELAAARANTHCKSIIKYSGKYVHGLSLASLRPYILSGTTRFVPLIYSSTGRKNPAKRTMNTTIQFGLRRKKKRTRWDLISIWEPACSRPAASWPARRRWMMSAWLATWLRGHSFGRRKRTETFSLRVKWLKAGAALHWNELKWRRHRWSGTTPALPLESWTGTKATASCVGSCSGCGSTGSAQLWFLKAYKTENTTRKR